MSGESLTKREKKAQAELMKGASRKALASKLGVSKSTAYNIAKKLEEKGAILRIGDKWSTPLYKCPPCARIVATGNEAASPLRGEGQVFPRIKSGRCPEGYVSPHVSSGVNCLLNSVGGFGTLRDGNGFVRCYWGDPKYSKRNSQTTRTGCVLREGCAWRFTYYNWATGTESFILHPPRQLVKVGSCDDILSFELETYRREGEEVLSILSTDGWDVRMGEVKVKLLHNAREGDPLASFIGPGHSGKGFDVVSDRSPGYPETEMEGCEDPEKVRIYANLPSTLKDMGAQVDSVSASINALGSEFSELRAAMAEQKAADEELRKEMADLREVAYACILSSVSSARGAILSLRIARATAEAMQCFERPAANDYDRLSCKARSRQEGRP